MARDHDLDLTSTMEARIANTGRAFASALQEAGIAAAIVQYREDGSVQCDVYAHPITPPESCCGDG